MENGITKQKISDALLIIGSLFFVCGLFLGFFYGFDPDPEMVPVLDKYGRQTDISEPKGSLVNDLGFGMLFAGPVLVLASFLVRPRGNDKTDVKI